MHSSNSLPAVPAANGTAERNCREVILFPSDEECRKAIKVLMDLRERHTFTSYQNPNEWWLYTDTVRKLKQHGVQFQWLTENV